LFKATIKSIPFLEKKAFIPILKYKSSIITIDEAKKITIRRKRITHVQTAKRYLITATKKIWYFFAKS